MNPLTLKALLAAVALVVTGGVTAGTVALLDAPGDASGNHAQTTFGGRVLDSWTGDIKDGVTRGSIDFRSFDGTIHVAAWNRSGYEVTLLAPPESENAQRFGDAEVEPAFTASVKNGSLDLALTVLKKGNLDVSYDASHRFAIVAFVPDLAWSTVNACVGTGHGRLGEVVDALVGDAEDEPVCIERDGTPRVSARLGEVRLMDEEDRPAWHVPFALDGITGADARVTAEYADLAFTNVTFTTLTAFTEYGSIGADGLVARNVTAFTEYGDVVLHAARVTDVTAGTEYGDVTLDTDFEGAANAALSSEYGDVKVLVPAEGERAYRVTATTEYGTLRIRLPGVTNAGNASEDPEGTTTTRNAPALALPGVSAAGATPAAGDARGVKTFKGETEDFDAYTDRLTLKLVTEYGNVRASASGADTGEREDDA